MKKKFWTKQNIIIVVICAILVAAIVTVSVVLSEMSKKEKTADASVARGSLSNNVNSSGTIVETGISGAVPLYACAQGVTDMEVLEDYDSNFSWSSYIFDAVRNETPLMYYVVYANPAMRGTRNYFHTSDESEIIFTASPMTLNTEKLVEDYEAAKASGEITSDIALYDFFFLVILGSGADNPGDIPVKYLQFDISKTVVVTTAYLKELIEVNASPEETDSFEYTITNFSLKEGDVVSLDKRVFNFAVSQLYTTFTVTEYDVASIDAKLREAEKLSLEDGKKHGVYAAVSINALDGRKVVAEILSVVKGSYSGGISYYSVQAKIIFASETELDLTVEENRSPKVARSALQADPDATSVVCGDYTYYDYVDETSYTFTDLDPEAEYYVGVRSHYVSLFSDSQPMCALGVAAPEALVATDIDSRGSFTANWNPAPKAQGYTVDLYGIDELEADAQDYTIFEENFDKVDESVTQKTNPANPDMLFNDYEPISLDDYTQYPGWTGLGNTVAVGMLGCAAPMYYVNYISTPEIFVGGSNVVYVTLKAYGTAGDNLYMLINGVGYGLPFDTAADGTGVIDGTFILEVTDPTIQIEFSSYNYYPFILDGIRFSQDLKKGDVVRTHLASADTDAETTSYVFTNLGDYDFQTFGYTVTSKFEAEEGSTVSQPSDIVTVDIVNGTSTGIESAVESGELKVVGRYGIDGSRLAAPQRGVNILKMSDGSIRKVLVK